MHPTQVDLGILRVTGENAADLFDFGGPDSVEHFLDRLGLGLESGQLLSSLHPVALPADGGS